MSILIKGIRKPDTCIECKFFTFERMIGSYCAIDKNITFQAVWDGSNICYKRNGDCPIVEIPTPHGQLKDADALAKVMCEGISPSEDNEGFSHPFECYDDEDK